LARPWKTLDRFSGGAGIEPWKDSAKNGRSPDDNASVILAGLSYLL
jgi:hypothetical protein